MQRVRMSLPFYKENGWEAEVVTVYTKYVEGFKDEYLSETIPSDIKIHYVKAIPTWLTRKIGLGSLSLRALLFYFIKVNKLLIKEKYDLIFFSTTMFHVGVLGPYWKWRYKVPYVVDLQDPWRNDFYLDKPKSERPPKFWFAYKILSWTEAIAIPNSSGIISVSEGYLSEIKRRYPSTEKLPMKVIPFGTSRIDFELINRKGIHGYKFFEKNTKVKNVVYLGAVTPSFIPIIEEFFKVLLMEKERIANYQFYFIGTSYSISDSKPLINELADKLGISDLVTEHTRRIPYFQTLATLKKADILFIPGSLEKDYNASKVYNAILSETPIFSVFHNKSEVKKIIEESESGIVIGFDSLNDLRKKSLEINSFYQLPELTKKNNIPLEIMADYRVKEQCEFFNKCKII
jgi:glycosyltransferase involved in cell wall biosynthesis